jgi:hypothetical protein
VCREGARGKIKEEPEKNEKKAKKEKGIKYTQEVSTLTLVNVVDDSLPVMSDALNVNDEIERVDQEDGVELQWDEEAFIEIIDLEDESEVSIIEEETAEEEEVSAGDNTEDSEDEIDLQEAFMACGGLDDLEDDGEEEIQVLDQVGPDVEEQGRGTDDTDFLFEKLVKAVNDGEKDLDWLMSNIALNVMRSEEPGIGKKIALYLVTKLVQIPDEEHAYILMKWKMEQIAKQRKAWKK